MAICGQHQLSACDASVCRPKPNASISTHTHVVYRMLSFQLGLVLSAFHRSSYHRTYATNMRCYRIYNLNFFARPWINRWIRANIPISRIKPWRLFCILSFGSTLRPAREVNKYYRLSHGTNFARCFFICDKHSHFAKDPKNQLHRSLHFTLHTQRTIIFFSLLHYIHDVRLWLVEQMWMG